MNDDATPYAGLTPDTVLNALDSIGLLTDGRQLALNSYENRVFQVGLEDGSFVVAKFYRPGRWSDEQILEEHGFIAELAELEIPAVPALAIDSRTLHRYEGFRFAVFARRGGRAPNLDDPGVREWLGRFIGRIHAVGRTRPFTQRPALDVGSFGIEPRGYVLEHDWLPAELKPVYAGVSQQALEAIATCYQRAGAVRTLRLHGDVHEGNVLWTDSPGNVGPHFVDFDDSRMGPAVQDLWMLLGGERAEQTICSRATRTSASSTGASCTWSRHCERCACFTTRRGSRDAGTTRRSRRRSRGSTRSATGRIASSNCASRSRRCRMSRWSPDLIALRPPLRSIGRLRPQAAARIAKKRTPSSR
jgi:Ser/Thr protein kinase RdoA (MazF antagonist)